MKHFEWKGGSIIQPIYEERVTLRLSRIIICVNDFPVELSDKMLVLTFDL